MAGLFRKKPTERQSDYTLFLLEDPTEQLPMDSDAIVVDDESTDRTPKQWFWQFIPTNDDDTPIIVRKVVSIVAALAILVSLVYLVNELWLVPLNNESVNKQVADMYDAEEFPPQVEDFTQYPEGMNPAFKALYYENHDVRGWLSYPSTSKDWYGINYPVVQTTDNDKYLYTDFFGKRNKNGTLFFDCKNDFSSPAAKNRVTVIYGHNMLSGQMLASLNKLLLNVGMARSAPLVDMNTLYEDASYKVFSVFIWDNERPDFNYMQTTFTSDNEFMNYVAQIRERSWYDYKDVDVLPGDELLVLSTCSNTSQTHLSDGRTVVVARKLRDGESRNVVTSHIVKNNDPLQPIAWYEAENKTLPSYYDITTVKGAENGTKPNGSTANPNLSFPTVTTVSGVRPSNTSTTTTTSGTSAASNGTTEKTSVTSTKSTGTTKATGSTKETTAKPSNSSTQGKPTTKSNTKPTKGTTATTNEETTTTTTTTTTEEVTETTTSATETDSNE